MSASGRAIADLEKSEDLPVSAMWERGPDIYVWHRGCPTTPRRPWTWTSLPHASSARHRRCGASRQGSSVRPMPPRTSCRKRRCTRWPSCRHSARTAISPLGWRSSSASRPSTKCVAWTANPNPSDPTCRSRSHPEQRPPSCRRSGTSCRSRRTSTITCCTGSTPCTRHNARAFCCAPVLDLPYREIGEMLDMPEGTAMSHVHRARQQLVDQLRGAAATTTEARKAQ